MRSTNVRQHARSVKGKGNTVVRKHARAVKGQKKKPAVKKPKVEVTDFFHKRALEMEAEAKRLKKENAPKKERAKRSVGERPESSEVTFTRDDKEKMQQYMHDYFTSGRRTSESGAANYVAQRLHDDKNRYGNPTKGFKAGVSRQTSKLYMQMNGDY